ncbi:hypothetical protein CPAV1605_1384 [seawater metagenome]|uniref:2'-5' RNA ligase superfamily n=1 Tax=seawater metagenome TaxID=1561972 RepID=A0A5E8CMA8_9ZZZZ
MPGITLIFDQISNQKLEQEYKKINDKFQKELLSIKPDLKPHITLMHFPGDEGDIYYEKIKLAITKTANQFKSYKININGLAMFVRGDKYILYFTTPYNRILRKIHKKIWKELKNIYSEDNLYSPKVLTPHITIPIYESNKENTFRVLEELSKMDFDFELTVSDIAYITGNLHKPKVFFKQTLLDN